jgi:hypothetical protein
MIACFASINIGIRHGRYDKRNPKCKLYNEQMADYIPGDLSSLEHMLGLPVDISGASSETNIKEINYLASVLYRETVILMTAIGSIVAGGKQDVGLTRNQAICAGLIIHTSKLMTGVVQFLATLKSGVLIKTLNRCIFEASTNLQFLITKDDNGYYERFVAYSLGPERELYDDINAAIKQNNGAILPIEERMLKSIAAKCKMSGVNIDEIPARHREWATNMRERLKAINAPGLYNTYRLLSHSIHVSWIELLASDIEQDDATGLFKPRLERKSVDARILTPVAVFGLRGAKLYLEHFFKPIPPVKLLLERIEKQTVRLIEIDNIHERLFSARQKGVAAP